MKRLFAFVAILVFVSACTETTREVVSEKKAPTPAAPAVSEEQPYTGGLTKEMRISDAQTIIGILERKYAPRDWKRDLLGIQFEEMSAELLAAVSQDVNDLEFYSLVGKYIAGFQDSHTSFNLPSTAVASLPISTDDIEGHVIIIDVDGEDPTTKGINIGDELVAIDDVPIADIMKDLSFYIANGNPKTTAREVANHVTVRPQFFLPFIPEKDQPARVSIISKATGETGQFDLKWKLDGFKMTPLNDPGIKTSKINASEQTVSEKNILDRARERIHPRLKWFSPNFMLNRGPFFPLGDSFVERRNAPYLTGVFVVEDKKIGFIRIHTYSDRHVNPKDALNELEEEISYFEDNTDALIIDQTGNGGGDWCYTLSIASLFFDKPFDETPDRWRANRENLMSMEEISQDLNTPALERQAALVIAQKIREAMEKGDLLTDPVSSGCYIDGRVTPYKTTDGRQLTYTKPILLLINELSVSCGDSFPALMQDEGRATLFGAATSGAGGAVGFSSRVGYSEISLGYTISLGWRKTQSTTNNGLTTNYFENVGVKPDIEYPITLDEFHGGFLNYREAVIESALGLIENEEAKKAKEAVK